MKQWNALPKIIRILICFCISCVAVLSLGTVKVRDGMKSRSMEQKEALDACRMFVTRLENGLPEDQKKAWECLVQQDPCLCLKSVCGELTRLDEKENP